MTETNLLTERELGIIEGKIEVGHITKEDANKLLYYIEELHGLLNEGDQDDAFGTEGWRHRIGFE